MHIIAYRNRTFAFQECSGGHIAPRRIQILSKDEIKSSGLCLRRTEVLKQAQTNFSALPLAVVSGLCVSFFYLVKLFVFRLFHYRTSAQVTYGRLRNIRR